MKATLQINLQMLIFVLRVSVGLCGRTIYISLNTLTEEFMHIKMYPSVEFTENEESLKNALC